MADFQDVSGWQPTGPDRRWWLIGGGAAALVVVVVVLVVLAVLPRGSDPVPVAAAPPVTPGASSSSPVATPAAGPAPCDAASIGASLGQPVTSIAWCEGDWAYVDVGDGMGDSTKLVRRSGAVWALYTAFPSAICRAQAVSDGVPARELTNFFADCPGAGRTTTETAAPTTGSTDLDGGALLGVGVALTVPSCDGSGIVVLGSAVTPGRYAEDVAGFLAAFPGSSYLRTDRSCPSLRQATAAGDPIYAVFVPVGSGSTASICAAVAAVGGDAYGKRLDTTSDPTQTVAC